VVLGHETTEVGIVMFYLGTHRPNWLARPDVPPLFVSHRQLRDRRTLPVATGRWALDSGGFTEIATFGRWEDTPTRYIAAGRRYRDECGGLDWCAPQDWMCEPWMVDKTGLTVADHQRLTIESYLTLSSEAPDVPFVPVLQGWTLADYLGHIDAYAAAGVDLRRHATVGLGSVCRRQATAEIGALVARIAAEGIQLHGFGVKGAGIRRYGHLLASADSMAWSFRGRRISPCPHTGVKSCANCYPHAMEWRQRALAFTPRPVQMGLAL
jgi:hypothetical protein